jgi:hypothetical protein
LAVGIRSLYGVLKLLWHAQFGQELPYDPKTIEENIFIAFTPIESGATLEECYRAVARLITMEFESKGRLKATIKKRISEYEAVIKKLKSKNEYEHNT